VIIHRSAAASPNHNERDNREEQFELNEITIHTNSQQQQQQQQKRVETKVELNSNDLNDDEFERDDWCYIPDEPLTNIAKYETDNDDDDDDDDDDNDKLDIEIEIIEQQKQQKRKSQMSNCATPHSLIGKSRFYLQSEHIFDDDKSRHQRQTPTKIEAINDRITSKKEENKDEIFSKSIYECYEGEIIVSILENIWCAYPRHTQSSQNDIKSNVFLKGALLLTPFRLIFLPYKTSKNLNEMNKCADPPYSNLFMFTNETSTPFSVIIPLLFINRIYQIVAETSTERSDNKQKKIQIDSETLPMVARLELSIECKNFMTKYFELNNSNNNSNSSSLNSTTNETYDFMTILFYYLNNNRVIYSRFDSLIFNLNNNGEAEKSAGTGRGSSSRQHRSFLMSNDLQKELYESECDDFLTTKKGYISIKTRDNYHFIINTSMPFCALPTSLNSLILTKRIGYEPTLDSSFSNDSSTLSSNTTKTNRMTSFLTSPTKNSSQNKLKSSTLANKSSIVYPLLCDNPFTNPFYDNKYPLWSFTSNYSGSSLVIIHEPSSPNRQDECNIIIKNYNSFLLDNNRSANRRSSKNNSKVKTFF
jgi:hypothetical protein